MTHIFFISYAILLNFRNSFFLKKCFLSLLCYKASIHGFRPWEWNLHFTVTWFWKIDEAFFHYSFFYYFHYSSKNWRFFSKRKTNLHLFYFIFFRWAWPLCTLDEFLWRFTPLLSFLLGKMILIFFLKLKKKFFSKNNAKKILIFLGRGLKQVRVGDSEIQIYLSWPYMCKIPNGPFHSENCFPLFLFSSVMNGI